MASVRELLIKRDTMKEEASTLHEMARRWRNWGEAKLAESLHRMADEMWARAKTLIPDSP